MGGQDVFELNVQEVTKMTRTWKIAGINFDHMHMGDLLRMVSEHPNAEIVSVSDEQPDRMRGVMHALGIPSSRGFGDYRQCLEETEPDIVILCPATAHHGKWVERVAPFGVHVFVEKPFAGSLPEADRMIAAMKATGKQMVINWPLRWYPSHVTAKRLVDEGQIGEVIEVHYYDGNRGPLRHIMDKIEVPESDPAVKNQAWWYQKDAGGGSMQDYLGYGVTLGTWFLNGKAPIEVTSTVDAPKGLEVDEHSITVCRYETGLSKYETRWGAFTDPWKMQPQPKCGFVLVGTCGTISSYDYENTVLMQTREDERGIVVQVDQLEFPNRNPIEYFLDRLDKDLPAEGPLSPAIARIGQQIVDTARASASQKRTLPLIP
ncbi:MAG: Gfo/Idh/MocA family oxidoreductase [Fimbriimonas sp.]|nr:Gfo/Idh/MocA family oxidoreductase [Fimbriimonas sp.]